MSALQKTVGAGIIVGLDSGVGRQLAAAMSIRAVDAIILRSTVSLHLETALGLVYILLKYIQIGTHNHCLSGTSEY